MILPQDSGVGVGGGHPPLVGLPGGGGWGKREVARGEPRVFNQDWFNGNNDKTGHGLVEQAYITD